MRRVPWRGVLWGIAISGVVGACIGGTVVTHGVAAPLFMLVGQTIALARKDLKARDKVQKSRDSVEGRNE